MHLFQLSSRDLEHRQVVVLYLEPFSPEVTGTTILDGEFHDRARFLVKIAERLIDKVWSKFVIFTLRLTVSAPRKQRSHDVWRVFWIRGLREFLKYRYVRVLFDVFLGSEQAISVNPNMETNILTREHWQHARFECRRCYE